MFNTETRPKARKPHGCQMCRRTIHPGETYRRGVTMMDGTAWTFIECAHCAAFIRVAYRRSWMDEGYDEDLLRDFAPDNIQEARVWAQYRRRWQRADGSLFPIPTVVFHEDRHGFAWPVAIEAGAA